MMDESMDGYCKSRLFCVAKLDAMPYDVCSASRSSRYSQAPRFPYI